MNTAINTHTPNFSRIFNEIETEIEFNTLWKNDKKYLDSLVDEDLQANVTYSKPIIAVKTVDDIGRRVIIIIIKDEKNVVIYERYAVSISVIISNMTYRLKGKVGKMIFNDDEITDAYGNIIYQVFLFCKVCH